MSSPLAAVSSLHLTAGSDIVWGAALLVAAAIYGWTVGRDRSVTILVSLYATLAILSQAPIISTAQRWFHLSPSPTASILWFLGTFAAVYLLLWYGGLFHDLSSHRGSWWQETIMGILQIGLAVCMALILMPADATKSLPGRMPFVFLSDAGRTFWLLAPFIFVLFLRDELPRFESD